MPEPSVQDLAAIRDQAIASMLRAGFNRAQLARFLVSHSGRDQMPVALIRTQERLLESLNL